MHRTRKLDPWVAVILCTLLTPGCSKTATIYLKNGSTLEARIVRGDAVSVFVRSGVSSTDMPVFRSDIKDIDHPGNVAALIGTPLALGGYAFTIIGLISKFDRGGDMSWIAIPGLIAALPGTFYGVWGWVTWINSRVAASMPSGVNATPVAMTDGKRTYLGLGMSWRW